MHTPPMSFSNPSPSTFRIHSSSRHATSTINYHLSITDYVLNDARPGRHSRRSLRPDDWGKILQPADC